MTRFRLAAFCAAILTVAGCGQMATDPAKTTADKPAAPVSQPATPDTGRGGDGGGGY
jgi:hypothetical protein